MRFLPQLRVAAIIALCLAFVAPLFVLDSSFFPYIVPKNILFRICVEVAVSLWVAMALIDARYRPRLGMIGWSAFAFTTVVLIADLAGVDPLRSLWSNFERMEGWVGLAHLFAWFVVLGSLLRDRAEWAVLAWTSTAVSLIVLLVAFVEGGRPASTLGNSTYLAIYLLLHGFLVLYWFARSYGKGKQPDKSTIVMGWVVIALYTMGIIMTQTRGTLVAIAASVGVMAILVAVREKSRKVLRRSAFGVLAAVVILTGVLYVARDSQFVESQPVLARAASVFDIGSGTVKARFDNWQIAWEGVKERPFLGWGQENYLYVFGLHYNPQMYAQEPWFDRSHNVFLDWLVASGVVGLIAYLFMFVAAFIAVRRADLSSLEKTVIIGAIVASFVHNLFVFDSLTSSMFFMAILAYLAGPVGSGQDVEKKELKAAKVVPTSAAAYVVAGASILALVLVYVINVPAIQVNAALVAAMRAPTIQERIDSFDRALNGGFLGRTEASEQFALMTQSIRPAQITPESKAAFMDAALAAANDEYNRVPMSVRALTFVSIAANQSDKPAEAIVALERARELSPRRQGNLFQLGFTYLAVAEYDKALEVFKDAYDAAPEYALARINYAVANIYAGNRAEANKLLEGVDVAADKQLSSTLVTAYMAVKDYPSLIAVLKPLAAASSTDVQADVSLAVAYFLAGQKQTSITVLQELIKVNTDPAIDADLQSIINDIKAGRNPLE